MIPCPLKVRPKTNNVKRSRDSRDSAKTKTKPPKKFAFIPVDGNGKTTARDRLVIRSHCMHGKNVRRMDGRPNWDRHCGGGGGDSSEDAVGSFYWTPGPLTVAPSELALFPLAGEVDFASRILIFNCVYIYQERYSSMVTDFCL